MAEKAVPMTRDGITKLQKELDHLLEVRRPEVADRIHAAKELASAQNNAEYEDAKNEQAFVEGRILTLEHMLQNVTVIDEAAAHGASFVKLGGSVTVDTSDGKEVHYTIVGPAEAAPTQGKLSNESPVGRALMGKRIGDEVQVQVPKGVLRLTIKKID
jgi:transcription elongation factor GreA